MLYTLFIGYQRNGLTGNQIGEEFTIKVFSEQILVSTKI
jgi:hypothetical protein